MSTMLLDTGHMLPSDAVYGCPRRSTSLHIAFHDSDHTTLPG